MSLKETCLFFSNYCCKRASKTRFEHIRTNMHVKERWLKTQKQTSKRNTGKYYDETGQIDLDLQVLYSGKESGKKSETKWKYHQLTDFLLEIYSNIIFPQICFVRCLLRLVRNDSFPSHRFLFKIKAMTIQSQKKMASIDSKKKVNKLQLCSLHMLCLNVRCWKKHVNERDPSKEKSVTKLKMRRTLHTWSSTCGTRNTWTNLQRTEWLIEQMKEHMNE